jgi:cytochrome bd ubiquinol oxidase subunit I
VGAAEVSLWIFSSFSSERTPCFTADGRTPCDRFRTPAASGLPRLRKYAECGSHRRKQCQSATPPLSYLVYGQSKASVKGLSDFPQEQWPDRIPLLYYSYHIMVGLGTIFIAVMVGAAFLLWRKRLYESRWMLWLLMLCVPLPYVANTAGWMTAELGRQPWLIYGLVRTAHGVSPRVGAGNAWFTLIGFMGMYTVLSILFVFLVWREIEIGPEPHASHADAVPLAAD